MILHPFTRSARLETCLRLESISSAYKQLKPKFPEIYPCYTKQKFGRTESRSELDALPDEKNSEPFQELCGENKHPRMCDSFGKYIPRRILGWQDQLNHISKETPPLSRSSEPRQCKRMRFFAQVAYLPSHSCTVLHKIICARNAPRQ